MNGRLDVQKRTHGPFVTSLRTLVVPVAGDSNRVLWNSDGGIKTSNLVCLIVQECLHCLLGILPGTVLKVNPF